MNQQKTLDIIPREVVRVFDDAVCNMLDLVDSDGLLLHPSAVASGNASGFSVLGTTIKGKCHPWKLEKLPELLRQTGKVSFIISQNNITIFMNINKFNHLFFLSTSYGLILVHLEWICMKVQKCTRGTMIRINFFLQL